MITSEESGPDDENELIRTTEWIITTMHHLFLAVRTLKKLAAQLVAFFTQFANTYDWWVL